jgi:hypothetical protein
MALVPDALVYGLVFLALGGLLVHWLSKADMAEDDEFDDRTGRVTSLAGWPLLGLAVVQFHAAVPVVAAPFALFALGFVLVVYPEMPIGS